MQAGSGLAEPHAALTVASALTCWQFAPVVSAVLALAAAGYLLGAWRAARRHPARPWPARRAGVFFAGLAVIAVATQSSVGAYDDVLFSAHMVQHLLLIMVAPPLLVAGRPVTLLLHAAGNPVRGWVERAVRSRAVTPLTWPPGVVLLYAAVVAGTHLTPFVNLAAENGATHDSEYALYLLTGYLYFLPIVGSEPIGGRVPMLGRYLLLLVTMPVDTAVGVVLMLLPREPFPAYARAGPAWGPSPVADLHLGGFIMFAGGDVIMSVLAVAVAASVIRRPGPGPGHPWPGPDRLPDAPAALRATDDADLDAYNAYLASLAATGGGRAARTRRDPGRPSPPG